MSEKNAKDRVITKYDILQIHIALYLTKTLFEKINIHHALFKYYDEKCVKPYQLTASKRMHKESILVLCQAIYDLLYGLTDIDPERIHTIEYYIS